MDPDPPKEYWAIFLCPAYQGGACKEVLTLLLMKVVSTGSFKRFNGLVPRNVADCLTNRSCPGNNACFIQVHFDLLKVLALYRYFWQCVYVPPTRSGALEAKEMNILEGKSHRGPKENPKT